MKKAQVGVDLAKDVIQVCIYSNKKVRSNTEMTPAQFTSWLFNCKPATIIFEACGTSNYWKQKAAEAGHDARLISAKLVSSVRQTQKTDKNDALAIVQAAQLPEITFISGKTVEQQQLQSIKRLRELAVKQQNASKKQLVSLIDVVHVYDDCLEKSVEAHPDCKKLLKLEGVGVMNAINLYIALGCSDLGQFSRGKDASACIGLTPIQYSSGGKIKLGSIGKHIKNSLLRSQLVVGAMSAVHHAVKREAKTRKDIWIKGLVERRGKKCAAVALANKTVRTAFAMLTQGTEYKAELLTA